MREWEIPELDFEAIDRSRGRSSQAPQLARDPLPQPQSQPADGKWLRPSAPSRALAQAAWCLFAALSACIASRGWLAGMESLTTFGLVGVAAGLVRYARLCKLKVEPGDEGLLEDPDDLDVCLVEVTIVKNFRRVGSDRGAAWFDQGRFLFSGARTSFVLGGEDVLPKSEWHRFRDREGTMMLPEDAIPLRIDGVKAYLEPTALTRSGIESSMRQELRFVRNLRRFRETPEPATQGAFRQWPPLDG